MIGHYSTHSNIYILYDIIFSMRTQNLRWDQKETYSLRTSTDFVLTFSLKSLLWISGKAVIEKNVQSAEGFPHEDSKVDGDAEGTPTNNRVSLEPPPSLPDTPHRTPGDTQESRDEFLERVMSLDPMEGKHE